jgi:integrase
MTMRKTAPTLVMRAGLPDHAPFPSHRSQGDCGLRLDELTQLKADDVRRSGRQAYVKVLGKRGRTRDVPVPSSLLRRLDRLIESRPDERDSDGIFVTYRRNNDTYTRSRG